MNKKLNVLITGCGGDIGQSIGKILKSRQDLFSLVLGADIHDNHPGKFIFDLCIKLPKCDLENYDDSLIQVIKLHEINLIIPTSEPELRRLLIKKYSKGIYGVPAIFNNLQTLQIGFDKLSTAKFLAENGLPFPKTALLTEADDFKYPFIIKSKNGSGSKNINLVSSPEEFKFYLKKYPDFIAQEYLPDEEGEYTCGLFRSSRGEIRDIIFKRKLTGGFSSFGERIQNKEITTLLHRLANLLSLQGSINVQLRLVNKIPYIFEINPRFSSTVLFRHLMGFEDVIWSIQDSLNSAIDDYHVSKSETKFYKGFAEYID